MYCHSERNLCFSDKGKVGGLSKPLVLKDEECDVLILSFIQGSLLSKKKKKKITCARPRHKTCTQILHLHLSCECI